MYKHTYNIMQIITQEMNNGTGAKNIPVLKKLTELLMNGVINGATTKRSEGNMKLNRGQPPLIRKMGVSTTDL